MHDRALHQRPQQRIAQRHKLWPPKLGCGQPRRPGVCGAVDQRPHRAMADQRDRGRREGSRRVPAFHQRARQRAAQGLVVAVEQEPRYETREQLPVLWRFAHLDTADDHRKRIAGLSAVDMRHREVEVGVDEQWLQRDRALVMRNRLDMASGFREREAEAVVRERRLRLQLHGGAQLRDRVLVSALFAQRIAEVEPRLREIRIERDGADPVADRLRLPARAPTARGRGCNENPASCHRSRWRGRSARPHRRCAPPHGRAHRANAARVYSAARPPAPAHRAGPPRRTGRPGDAGRRQRTRRQIACGNRGAPKRGSLRKSIG